MNYKNAYEEMKRLYDKLQQENQQLKADLTKEELAYSNLRDTYNKKYDECKLYKEVIEEVREVAKELKLHYQQHPTMIPSVKLNKLLQILDKGVKND